MDLQTAIPALVANNGGDHSGLGVGGGLIGGLLLGSLLRGNGGLFGNGGSEGGVTAADLSAQIASVKESQANSAILDQLADIKASVPYSESQTQLFVANTAQALRNQLNQTENVIQQGLVSTNQNISGLATLITQNGYNTERAIAAEGEKTRAQAQLFETANTQRLLAERQDEINELKAAACRDRSQHSNDLQFQALFSQIGGMRSTINVGYPSTTTTP